MWNYNARLTMTALSQLKTVVLMERNRGRSHRLYMLAPWRRPHHRRNSRPPSPTQRPRFFPMNLSREFPSPSTGSLPSNPMASSLTPRNTFTYHYAAIFSILPSRTKPTTLDPVLPTPKHALKCMVPTERCADRRVRVLLVSVPSNPPYKQAVVKRSVPSPAISART